MRRPPRSVHSRRGFAPVHRLHCMERASVARAPLTLPVAQRAAHIRAQLGGHGATRELSLGSSPEPPAVARSAVSATGELAPDGPRPLGAVIAAATAAAAAAAAAVEEDVARAVRRHLAWRVKRSAAHLWPES